MKLYEGFFILPPDATADARKAQVTNLENQIQKFGGRIQQRHEIGRRPLGYLIKKCKEGHQLLLDFEIEPAAQQELRKALELQEDLLTYMITVKRPKPELPQAAPKPQAAPAHQPVRPPRRPAPSGGPSPSKPSEKVPVQ